MEQLIPPQTRRVTVDEYLRMEEASETKHEFRDGRIIDVAGGTFAHGDIAANLIFQLKTSSKATHARQSAAMCAFALHERRTTVAPMSR
jgi:Uma2 family endonuclease